MRLSPEKIDPSRNPNALYIGLEHIESGTRRLAGKGIARDVRSAKSVFNTGDLLYGKLRPYLNKVWFAQEPGVCSTDILVLQSQKGVETSFLARLIGMPAFIDFAMAHSAGINLPRASFKKLREYVFPLPPLAEQRRIVARLEKLEAPSRRARAALDAIPPLLAQTRQSLLAAAFRGDLTSDWRQQHPPEDSGSSIVTALEAAHGEAGGHKLGNAAQASEGVHDLTLNDFPASWGLTDLRNLCPPGKPITYGILMPGPDRADGVPYIRVADFPGDTINMETIRRTSKEMDAKFARSRLSTGDLLLSIRGSVGRLTTIPSELNGANITQDSARLSISKKVVTRFAEHMLRAPQTQTRMQLAVKGVAVRGINIGDVRSLQMPIPPLTEQREIVRRLDHALARLDATAAAHTAAVAELDRLDQSLLAQAFSGKLVKQDPADEPASVLLASIRASPSDQA